MRYQELREELYRFYLNGDEERGRAFAKKCFALMDERATEDMSVAKQKMLQYDVICEQFEPVIFKHCPFYYETGFLTSTSDGARVAKGYGFPQANGWVYERNKHLFIEQDEALYKRKAAHTEELLYLICGRYNDDAQHFNFNNRPILRGGLKSIYEIAKAGISAAKNSDESEFLEAVCFGMLALKRCAEKFSRKADELLACEKEDVARKNLEIIRDTAKRVPWEAPNSFYEALATLAFLRAAFGSLEGAGPNTFGRLDVDLIDFYRADIERGAITPSEAYELVSQFLIIWDCHYDHDMKMVGYADHELENTYTLGGCDAYGESVYNEITKLFLEATEEHKIIFPKIKCRFSSDSPKEYLDIINRSIVRSTSTVLLLNDEAIIPALVRGGRTLSEARDYYASGCWSLVTIQEKHDHGNYVNLLKPFEFAIHGLKDKIDKVGIDFETIIGNESFEELYAKVLRNCEKLVDARLDVTRRGGQILNKVNVFPIFSATIEDCLLRRADYGSGGGRYRDDHLLMFGFPNVVDSLLAIKELVFEEGRYTLCEFLDAVRNNWQGCEDMRTEAIRCHGWGDGTEKSSTFARRFNDDLYAICNSKVGSYGGKVHLGHLTYTEIRWWGEKTLATPDGRGNGEYFAQGLTPSRLKRIPSATSVINSLAALDASVMAGNSVVNMILPNNISLDRCEGFLRALSKSAVQSLQLNCATREQLLDAREHPENYPDLVVRVTGFSAKFTSLSREWQDEVITRNFYD